MGDDSDQLLGEDVEGVAREAGGLDVPLVHGLGDGGTGDQVGAVFRKQNALADGVDRVAGAADTLHAAGNRGWGLDLDDEIDRAHVDAEFESGGGAEGFDLAGLELLLDNGPLVGGQGAMVGAGDGFAGQIVERTGEAFGYLAAVDEENCGVAFTDEFEETGVNRTPDRHAAGNLRGGARRNFLHLIETGHIFNWNFNSQF